MSAVRSRLEISVTSQASARRLTLTGAIDRSTVRELIARVWTAGGPDAETIVLDLRGVTFIDVRALASLLGLKDLLGRRLEVVTPPAPDPATVAESRRASATGAHQRLRLRHTERAAQRA